MEFTEPRVVKLKSSLTKSYSCNQDFVNRFRMSVSQMTLDMFRMSVTNDCGYVQNVSVTNDRGYVPTVVITINGFVTKVTRWVPQSLVF